MAAESAAVTVGRYVRAVILNCQLSIREAGAKIGNYWIKWLLEFRRPFGETHKTDIPDISHP